jgi:hypothetical protein
MGFSEPNISLKFKDFEELRIEEEWKITYYNDWKLTYKKRNNDE